MDQGSITESGRTGPVGLLLLVATLSGWLRAEDAIDSRRPTVGMPARIDQLVLPGSELEAVPIRDRETPVVLRIVDVYPHGPSAFRYDLVYYGLEPGDHDLRDYLRRKDRLLQADLPPITVTVRPVLPPGQIEPNALELKGTPRPGGYRLLIVLGTVAWVAVLVVLVNVGRRRRIEAGTSVARPKTLAERLRPLVEGAVAGTLTSGQHAELERPDPGLLASSAPPGGCSAGHRDRCHAATRGGGASLASARRVAPQPGRVSRAGGHRRAPGALPRSAREREGRQSAGATTTCSPNERINPHDDRSVPAADAKPELRPPGRARPAGHPRGAAGLGLAPGRPARGPAVRLREPAAWDGAGRSCSVWPIRSPR